MHECEGCGEDKGYGAAQPMKLLGGFSAVLCIACSNAWQEYATAHPLWQELLDSDAQREHFRCIAQAGIASEVQAIGKWYHDRDVIMGDLYEVAKRFVATLGRHGAGGDLESDDA